MILAEIQNVRLLEPREARMKRTHFLLAVAAATVAPAGGRAADPPVVKVGVIYSYSGSTASAGKTFDAAIATWVKLHGDIAGGHKIELIKRDDTGIAPDTARRIAQELIVQDKVDLLAGVTFTPNAIAVAGVSTQAKKPLFIVNAATSGIIAKHPYSARFGFTTAQTTVPFAQWAAKSGIKTAYAMFQDYGPGIDAGAAFASAFTAAGGKMLGEVRVPLNNSDFTAYVQRVKDAKPDAMYVFLNAGGAAQSLLRACRDAGFARAGIKVLAAGDLVAENNLPGVGEVAEGLITSLNYSANHGSRLNRDFVAAFTSIDPSLLPDFGAAAAYDVMNAIYRVVEAQKGFIDPDRTMELVRGMRFESPRGPIEIDPETRDVIQNVYIRRTERRGTKLVNVEFATIPMVRDPNERTTPAAGSAASPTR
jgi:branched-chain amino acid transport system substrate-binding protein